MELMVGLTSLLTVADEIEAFDVIVFCSAVRLSFTVLKIAVAFIFAVTPLAV